MRHKRHILITLFAFLFSTASVKSYAINSPVLHCVAVDSVGDVTLTWTLPSNLDPTFVNYDIYYSFNQNGIYSVGATVTNSLQTSVTINGLGANSTRIYFYIVTDTVTATNASTPIDTLSNIILNVINPGTGIAELQYNSIHTPNLPSSSGWYRIYREFPQYVWTEVDSTHSLIAIDTITVCSDSLHYKIEITDDSGCTSVSNIDGGLFVNKIDPPFPIMDTVSVTSTNGVSISWSRDRDNDVAGYVVYKRIGATWQPIATVAGINNTNLYVPNANPDSASIYFKVAAFDSCGNLGLSSNPQNTLYLIQAPDSCLSTNLLSWTAFNNLVPGVKQYNIYMSFDGLPFQLIGSTNSGTTSFLQTGLTNVGTYNYFVQVVDSLNPGITASSNIIKYEIYLQHVPKFSYLQTATVANNVSNEVSCYVDSTAHCSIYVLERSASASGSFLPVATANSIYQHVYFTDPSANPNQQSYYYKVITQNQCGINVDSSQVSQTMFLTASGDATGTNTLTWNDYSQWLNGVSNYSIYRNEDSGPFLNIANVPYTSAGTNVFRDDVSGVLQGQGIFSYYIVANEKPNGYPFIDTSASNIAQAYQDPRVYIPNAFVPNGKNSIFIPVFVFMDFTGYDLSIFNMWGQLMFETSDPTQGWDGKYEGRIAPEAVYVYHMIYTSSRGEYFERKGSVTLLK